MTKRDWIVLLSAIIIVGMAMSMVICSSVRVAPEILDRQPLIMEEGMEPFLDQNGEAIAYRYFVDGVDSFVIVRDTVELEKFKAYLRMVGRFVERQSLP